MKKQEEIREGFYRIILASLPDRGDSLDDEALCNDLLAYLNSQGAEIKVKCPDCAWSQFRDEAVGMTPCYRCNSTGFITEPLIEG